jgi:hypothetical protein
LPCHPGRLTGPVFSGFPFDRVRRIARLHNMLYDEMVTLRIRNSYPLRE